MSKFYRFLSSVGVFVKIFPKVSVVFVLILFAGAFAKADIDFFSKKETRTTQQIYDDSVLAYNDYLSGYYHPYIAMLYAEKNLAITRGRESFGVNSSETTRLSYKIEDIESQIERIESGAVFPELDIKDIKIQAKK